MIWNSGAGCGGSIPLGRTILSITQHTVNLTGAFFVDRSPFLRGFTTTPSRIIYLVLILSNRLLLVSEDVHLQTHCTFSCIPWISPGR